MLLHSEAAKKTWFSSISENESGKCHPDHVKTCPISSAQQTQLDTPRMFSTWHSELSWHQSKA